MGRLRPAFISSHAHGSLLRKRSKWEWGAWPPVRTWPRGDLGRGWGGSRSLCLRTYLLKNLYSDR